jgi:spermidine synthase
MVAGNVSRVAVIALFLFSGATALIYEVIWVRYFGLAFGSTTYSITTVLAAFMGGLAIGSLIIGKVVDRLGNRPLLVYAWLEAGIGVFGLLSPLIFDIFLNIGPRMLPESALMDSGSGLAIKFFAGFLLLMIPTTLMGGSLPALSRFLIRHPDEIKRDLGLLYSVNTIGAVIGAALAGFVLLYTVGLTLTLYFTAVVNLIIAWVAWRIDRSHGIAAVAEDVEDTGQVPERFAGKQMRWLLYGAFLISGGLALMYEVIWSRLLVQIIGSSTYGFTMILIAYLIGLAGGSYIVSRFVPTRLLKAQTFAYLQLGIAVGVFLLIPLLAWMPSGMLAVFQAGYDAYWQIASASFVLVLLLVLPSTLCMGATFPVVAHMVTQSEGSLGSDIGRAYFFNTFGAIIGTVLAGFVLIPGLGALPSMRLGISLNLALAAALLLGMVVLGKQIHMKKQAIIVTLAAAVLLIPVWQANWSSDLSSVNVAVYGQKLAAGDNKVKAGGLRFEQEGVNAHVTVRQTYDHRFLQVNGKADASTGTDMSTQLLFGLLPTLYHPQPGPTFMVGYGSGVTARVIAEEREQDSLEVAEIEQAVVNAGRFFADVNHQVETMPNVTIIHNDARNYLAGIDKRYSLIVSEPSNPWLAGIAGLFTRDFYALAKKHLEEDGIFVQWIQMYSLSSENTRMILATLLEEFEYAEVWESVPSDLIVIASNTPLKFSSDWRERLTRNPERWKEYSERLWIHSPDELLAHRRGGITSQIKGLSDFRNTDNRPRLEFSAPWSLYEDTITENRKWLQEYFPEGKYLKSASVEAARARYLSKGGLTSEANDWSLKAFKKAPNEFAVALTRAELLFAQGKPAEVVRILKTWKEEKDVSLNLLLAKTYISLGQANEAVSSLRNITDVTILSQAEYQIWNELAIALRKYDLVETATKARVEHLGHSYRTKHYTGVLAYRRGQTGKAEKYFREALELNPYSGVTLAYLGHSLWKLGRLKEAEPHYREFIQSWGENATIEKRLRMIEAL